jgi:hypothetical protein
VRDWCGPIRAAFFGGRSLEEIQLPVLEFGWASRGALSASLFPQLEWPFSPCPTPLHPAPLRPSQFVDHALFFLRPEFADLSLGCLREGRYRGDTCGLCTRRAKGPGIRDSSRARQSRGTGMTDTMGSSLLG